MAGDIVPLWGGELATGTTPVPCVVDMLRDLLARAERGEIVGLAVATVSGARTVETEWAEAGGFKLELAASVMTLHARMAGDLADL